MLVRRSGLKISRAYLMPEFTCDSTDLVRLYIETASIETQTLGIQIRVQCNSERKRRICG